MNELYPGTQLQEVCVKAESADIVSNGVMQILLRLSEAGLRTAAFEAFRLGKRHENGGFRVRTACFFDEHGLFPVRSWLQSEGFP